jgi:EF hand
MIEPTNEATTKGKRMTTKAAKKNRSRLQQDFIPNFEMRSILLIATFAVSAASAYAQTSGGPSQNNPVAITAAADRGDRPTEGATQVNARAGSNSLDAAFNRADTNRDGRLNREEAEHFPMLSQRFDMIDVNRDSFISRDEFNQAAGN